MASPVYCVACETVFFPWGAEPSPPWSRKAIASLTLGVASFVGLFFTAIPAVWLGFAALRDCRRSTTRLRGQRVAIGGIAAGLLFGLSCSLITASVIAGGLLADRKEELYDPAELARFSQEEFIHFDPPAGLRPSWAVRDWTFTWGTTRAMLLTSEAAAPAAELKVVRFPSSLADQPSLRLESMIKYGDAQAMILHGESKVETWTCRVFGRPVEVQVYKGDVDRRGPYLRYLAFFEIEDTQEWVGVMILTPSIPATGTEGALRSIPGRSLSRDEVRDCIESFRP